MRTTKAYLAGLGTTGILIASVLALMVVGTGFVAFQGLSDAGSPSRPLHRVVVEDDGPGREAGRRESSLRPVSRAERFRLGSRQQLATERRAARRRREAARRRDARGRSERSGGAEVPAGDVLGGGAGARTGDAGGTGSLPGGSGGPSGGQPGGGGGAPGSPPAGGGGSGGGAGSGGGLPIPAPAGDVLRRPPPPLAGLPDSVEGGAPNVAPPGLLP